MVALRLIASARPGAHRRPLPWVPVLLLVLAGVVTGVGWFVWTTTAPGRALRSLPAAERRVVYERTIDDLRTLCAGERPEALRAHCRELAAVVAPLEECGAECEALIRPILTPVPTR